MLRFVLRRLAYGFLVQCGVVVVVFLLFHALPGDPVALMAGQRSDLATREAIGRELGLDQPLWRQFAFYLNDLSPLSLHPDSPDSQLKYGYIRLLGAGSDHVIALKWPYLRRSFQTNQRVDVMIRNNIGSTLWLALAAMLLASTIGIGMGVLAAVRRRSIWDHLIMTATVIGLSIPSFVAALFIALIFGYYLSDFTGLNLSGQLWVNDPFRGRQLHLENLVLPAVTLSLRPMAVITQLTRNSMLEVLHQDYIRTARAKGLRQRSVIFRHALKNALNPVITSVTGWLATLMTGAFFVEYIFDWKGFGFMTIKAVQSLDFPVVMGSTLFIATLFVVINLAADLLYALADPRVRLE
jgi:ABC-type dipeptide/oligopeptide/nickel transport system permease component